MFLKNASARLITINSANTLVKDIEGKVTDVIAGKSYDLMPAGKAVEVPDSLCNENKFVKALLSTGDIVKTVEEDDSDSEVEIEITKMTKGQLIDFADANGIETDASAKKADILADIELALEADGE